MCERERFDQGYTAVFPKEKQIWIEGDKDKEAKTWIGLRYLPSKAAPWFESPALQMVLRVPLDLSSALLNSQTPPKVRQRQRAERD